MYYLISKGKRDSLDSIKFVFEPIKSFEELKAEHNESGKYWTRVIPLNDGDFFEKLDLVPIENNGFFDR